MIAASLRTTTERRGTMTSGPEQTGRADPHSSVGRATGGGWEGRITGSGAAVSDPRTAAYRAVVELPYDEGPYWMFELSGDPDDVKAELVRHARRLIRRTRDPSVALRTFGHLAGYMGGHPGRAGSCIPPSDGEYGGAYVAVRADAVPSTYFHEMLHLTANAHGYASDPTTTVAVIEAYDRDRDRLDFDSIDGDRTALLRLRPHAEWETGRDVPASVDRLVQAANDAWDRIRRVGARGGTLDDVLPKPESTISRYYAVSAEETLAAFQEVFQAEEPRQPPNWFFEHPELSRAYASLFDLSPTMRQVANYLHREHSRVSPWETLPYPNTTVSADVIDTWERASRQPL